MASAGAGAQEPASPSASAAEREEDEEGVSFEPSSGRTLDESIAGVYEALAARRSQMAAGGGAGAPTEGGEQADESGAVAVDG